MYISVILVNLTLTSSFYIIFAQNSCIQILLKLVLIRRNYFKNFWIMTRLFFAFNSSYLYLYYLLTLQYLCQLNQAHALTNVKKSSLLCIRRSLTHLLLSKIFLMIRGHDKMHMYILPLSSASSVYIIKINAHWYEEFIRVENVRLKAILYLLI